MCRDLDGFILKLMRMFFCCCCCCPDSLKPIHVGLRQEMPYFRTEESDKAPPVTYMHLYECDKFSVCRVKSYHYECV